MYVKIDVDDVDRNFIDDFCIILYFIEMFK